MLLLKVSAWTQICCCLDRFPAPRISPSPRLQAALVHLQIFASQISPALLDFFVLQPCANTPTNRQMTGAVLTNEMIPALLRVRSLYVRTSLAGGYSVTGFIYPRRSMLYDKDIMSTMCTEWSTHFHLDPPAKGTKKFEVGHIKLRPQLPG